MELIFSIKLSCCVAMIRLDNISYIYNKQYMRKYMHKIRIRIDDIKMDN